MSRSRRYRLDPIACTWLNADRVRRSPGILTPVCHAHSIAGSCLNCVVSSMCFFFTQTDHTAGEIGVQKLLMDCADMILFCDASSISGWACFVENASMATVRIQRPHNQGTVIQHSRMTCENLDVQCSVNVPIVQGCRSMKTLRSKLRQRSLVLLQDLHYSVYACWEYGSFVPGQPTRCAVCRALPAHSGSLSDTVIRTNLNMSATCFQGDYALLV